MDASAVRLNLFGAPTVSSAGASLAPEYVALDVGCENLAGSGT